MAKDMTYIYAMTIDWEQWYIGKADDPKKRYREHLREAFNTRGPDYDYRISEWIRSLPNPKEVALITLEMVHKNLWREAEREWVKVYRQDFGVENVMNMSDGGGGGRTYLKYPDWAVHLVQTSEKTPLEIQEELRTLNVEIPIKQLRALRRGDSRDLGNDLRPKQYDKSGENNPNSKLTQEIVQEIRGTKETITGAEWGRRLGMSTKYISRIRRGLIW